MSKTSVRVQCFVLGTLLGALAGCSVQTNGAESSPSQLLPTNPIASLDANGSGTVDAADSVLFQQISKYARAELGNEEYERQTLRLYTGPGDAGLEGLFGAVAWDQDGKIGLTGATSESLFALSKESSWLSHHAKLYSSQSASDAGWGTGGRVAHAFANYNQGSMEPQTVCEGIDALGIEAITARGVKAAAVFDLDNTIWAGHAIDPFLASLVDLEILPESSNATLKKALGKLAQLDRAVVEANSVTQNAQLLLERTRNRSFPKEARINRKDQFFLIAEIMAGLSHEDGMRAARHFFEVGTSEYPAWKGQIFASEGGCGMQELLGKLKAAGLDIYFISASLDVIVEAAGVYLGVDAAHRRGSPMELKGGLYTGRVESIYTLKAPVVRAWLEGPALLAFGDSARSDFQFMAEAAGAAFMINPDDKFLSKDTEQVGGRFVSVSFTNTVNSLAAKKLTDVP